MLLESLILELLTIAPNPGDFSDSIETVVYICVPYQRLPFTERWRHGDPLVERGTVADMKKTVWV